MSSKSSLLCASPHSALLHSTLLSHRMGTLLEPVERLGFRDAFRLIDVEFERMVRNHFRLFLTFFLIFRLPASVLGVFLNKEILKVVSPLQAATALNFFKAYSSSRQEDVYVDTDSQPSRAVMMSICALGLAIFMLDALAFSANAYIVKDIYSFEAGGESEDDRPTTKNVLKPLPRALLRLLVTYLWWYLVLSLIVTASLTLAFIFKVTWTAIAGGESDPNHALCLLFAGVPFLIGNTAMAIMLMLASCITVLEPKSYGLAALKVSTKYVTKYVRVSFTEFSIAFLVVLLLRYHQGYLIYIPTLDTMVMHFLYDVFRVLLYFVCKFKFEAVIPETIQSGSKIRASENPYQQLVDDTTVQHKTIDEPLS